MKKSTKITALILLGCFILIGIIGITKKSTKSTTNKSTTEKNITITIMGINETIIDHEEVDYNSQTVYDVLAEICDEHNIPIECKGTGNLVYISSIDHLAEFDHGSNSGWTYTVNDEYPSKSCGAYELEEGDEIEWIYVYE